MNNFPVLDTLVTLTNISNRLRQQRHRPRVRTSDVLSVSLLFCLHFTSYVLFDLGHFDSKLGCPTRLGYGQRDRFRGRTDYRHTSSTVGSSTVILDSRWLWGSQTPLLTGSWPFPLTPPHGVVGEILQQVSGREPFQVKKIPECRVLTVLDRTLLSISCQSLIVYYVIFILINYF